MTTRPLPTAAFWTFAGLRIPRVLLATGARAARWCGEGSEWVRPVIRPTDWRDAWTEDGPEPHCWAVDFPPGADERDVAGAGEPGRCFLRSGASIPRRGSGAELRIALAKCDRFLATPVAVGPARWRWLPATTLPCGRLVVVARDDEFLAGVLASRWFEIWRRDFGARLAVDAVCGFPLPWSPDTPRGALTREQEERRAAIVRAWRAADGGWTDFDPEGNAADDLAGAVAAAYGWRTDIEPDDASARLRLMANRPKA
jgi:hypothetical protein